jgi:hypothetical protein
MGARALSKMRERHRPRGTRSTRSERRDQAPADHRRAWDHSQLPFSRYEAAPTISRAVISYLNPSGSRLSTRPRPVSACGYIRNSRGPD